MDGDEATGEDDLSRAHRHSILHRAEILASERCGCFYCLSMFSPDEIRDWTDKEAGIGQTAICPECPVDSVIGSASGFPITAEFLKRMQERWFT